MYRLESYEAVINLILYRMIDSEQNWTPISKVVA